MQTYEEYLATMRAYNFYPLTREQWEGWQVACHGTFKASEVNDEV